MHRTIDNDRQRHLVIFQPLGTRGYIAEGKTLMDAAQELGVDLQSVCGGQGVCGKCKVEIVEGFFERYGLTSREEHLSPLTERERKFLAKSDDRMKGSYRLACQARIYGDVLVSVPEESRAGKQIIRKSITEIETDLKPAIRKYYVEVTTPTLDNSLADWERLQFALKKRFGLGNLAIDYQALLGLPKVMRQGNWKVTVSLWKGREVIRVEPGFVEKGYGLAVDIGSTTVAGYLCDLTTGDVVATDSMLNPQIVYGEDVMSRITYTMVNKNGLRHLNRVIVNGLNQIAGRVALKAGIKRRDVLDMTVVGNTCMQHLFLGIDPEYLGQSPFVPSICHSLEFKARDLGLKLSQGAYVYVLPVEAGFVGADNVGVLIAEEPYNQNEIMLIIDIGTNGELVLGNREKLICSSCATGPAFEGAHIKYGMRAAPGAIERVEIEPSSKEVRFQAIGKEGRSNSNAKGICGSGIIDAIAQMFKAEILQQNGRFNDSLETPRLHVTSEGTEFVIAWAAETSIHQDITVCQTDVRTVQLAKAAMYVGAKLMMRRLGMKKLDKVVLAGAFGSYIDKKSAMAIGLFPDCTMENVYSVGNAAGRGACLALLNLDKRRKADEIARKVEYVELTTEPDFERQFAEAMYFPHMKDSFPHLER